MDAPEVPPAPMVEAPLAAPEVPPLGSLPPAALLAPPLPSDPDCPPVMEENSLPPQAAVSPNVAVHVAARAKPRTPNQAIRTRLTQVAHDAPNARGGMPIGQLLDASQSPPMPTA